MESSSEDLFRKGGHSTSGDRVLLILAAAVFLLSSVALALSCVDAAVGGSAFPNYENGWSVGSMVLMYTGNAVYLPCLLLGLAALGLAQSKVTRGHATKMVRPLLFVAVLVIALGIGRAVCEVGSDYYAQMETLGWQDVQTVFRLLGRSLLYAGTLAGLAYLCRQHVGSPDPCETNNLD